MQQQTYLNSLLNQYQSMGPDSLAGAPTSIQAQLDTARAALAQMRAKYTDDHPDIKTLKDDIARLEKLKKDMGAEAKENLETNSATPAQVAAMTPLMQIQSQLKSNKQEIQSLEAKIQQLQATAQQYQQRMADTPAVSAQMDDIMRDYQATRKAYDDLLAKARRLAAGHEPAEAAAGRAVPHHRSSQPYRTNPRSPTASSSHWQDWQWESCWRCCLGQGLSSWTTAFAANRTWSTPLPCRCWWKFRRCQPEAEIRRARWTPWITAAVGALVAILIPTGILYACYWG